MRRSARPRSRTTRPIERAAQHLRPDELGSHRCDDDVRAPSITVRGQCVQLAAGLGLRERRIEALFEELEHVSQRICEAAIELGESRLAFIAPLLCVACEGRDGFPKQLATKELVDGAIAFLEEHAADGVQEAIMFFLERRHWRLKVRPTPPRGERPTMLPWFPAWQPQLVVLRLIDVASQLLSGKHPDRDTYEDVAATLVRFLVWSFPRYLPKAETEDAVVARVTEALYSKRVGDATQAAKIVLCETNDEKDVARLLDTLDRQGERAAEQNATDGEISELVKRFEDAMVLGMSIGMRPSPRENLGLFAATIIENRAEPSSVAESFVRTWFPRGRVARTSKARAAAESIRRELRRRIVHKLPERFVGLGPLELARAILQAIGVSGNAIYTLLDAPLAATKPA